MSSRLLYTWSSLSHYKLHRMKRFCGFMYHPHMISFAMLIIYFLVCCQRVGSYAAAARTQDSATHSNFVKANYYLVEESKSWQNVWCFKNASICLDPLKNPGGGSTCCWNTVCQNTFSDRNHCGGCGRSCLYGYTCCYGQCTDLLYDHKHCGSCETCCPENEKCEFGMCGYGSGGSYADVKQKSFHPKHW